MGLIRKSSKSGKSKQQQEVRPIIGKKVHCSVCRKDRPFTRCWLRVQHVRQCQCCGMQFESPAKLYNQTVPSCPHCGEYLEQPGFEYGLCDRCGSKFEVMSGTKPSLIPNKKQRSIMNKRGIARGPKK